MTEVAVLYRLQIDWGVVQILGVFHGATDPQTTEWISAREHAEARAALINGGALLNWKFQERDPEALIERSGYEAKGADGWVYVIETWPVEPLLPPPTKGHRRPRPDLSG